MSFLLPRSLPLSSLLRSTSTLRSISTTLSAKTATKDWQSLIGGRSGVSSSQKTFQMKYLAALEKKAENEGVSLEVFLAKRKEVEEIKEKELVKERVEKEIKAKEEKEEKERLRISSEGNVIGEVGGEVKSKTSSGGSSSDSNSPIKPLNSILDLSKASTLTPTQISQLWTTYHQSKTNHLSAIIPTKIYNSMISVAKKYPLFVLPLAREIVGDLPEGVDESGAVEMHLLEWALLPPPTSSLEPVPSPSTVLFTPLAEYKSRQSYAQPYLILSHYTDLSLSHDLVLMRGEITDNVALNEMEAQVLSVRLQLFYNWTGLGGTREDERIELLKTFYERPEEFDIKRLAELGREI